VAEEAVPIGPVSKLKFPVTAKITANFVNSIPILNFRTSITRANTVTYAQIPVDP
jgi:hypothetical protein